MHSKPTPYGERFRIHATHRLLEAPNQVEGSAFT